MAWVPKEPVKSISESCHQLSNIILTGIDVSTVQPVQEIFGVAH